MGEPSCQNSKDVLGKRRLVLYCTICKKLVREYVRNDREDVEEALLFSPI